MTYAISSVLSGFRHSAKSISRLEFIRCIRTIKTSTIEMAIPILIHSNDEDALMPHGQF